MADIVAFTMASWLVLGLCTALVIFLDQVKHDERNYIWPILGFILIFLGLLLFYLLVMRKRKKAPEYPAKPQYDSPSYKYEKKDEPPAPAPEKKEKVQQLEGAPRCESCGAAISVHDLKCPRCGKQLK
jgi:cytochrome c biogenesis protein CcdA